MIKYLLILVTVLAQFTNAQFDPSLKSNQGAMQGGFGMSWIDGNPHYSVRIAPEVAFGKIGLGLDLRFDITPDGTLRHENFNEVSDYLSIIRYFRYGQKRDPVFVRIGALDYATLGNGSIMYLYNNSPSFDTRRIGAQLDIDFYNFGFESVYSNFGERGIFGIRGYILPLKFTAIGDIPVIGNLELGATYTTDFNAKAGVISGNIDPVSKKFVSTKDEGATGIIGFDIGLPIVRNSLVDWKLYFDYAKIVNFGSGTSLGTMVQFNGLGLVTLAAKLERRFNSDNYLPAYFNSMYELERFNFDSVSGVSSKISTLANLKDVGNGFFGELFASVLGYVDILGSYQRFDKYPESGILHIASAVEPEGMPFILRAGYDKRNIKDEADLFKLDDRSYFFVETGYKPYPFLIVSLVYNWTFTPLRDADDNILSYEPQKRIEPRISFYYPLQF